jgi:hypothetical protein
VKRELQRNAGRLKLYMLETMRPLPETTNAASNATALRNISLIADFGTDTVRTASFGHQSVICQHIDVCFP